MLLVSTKNTNDKVDFKNALLNPSSKDGGLYTINKFPKFDGFKYKDLSYEDFAFKLIQSFDFGYEQEFKNALKTYENFDDKTAPIKLKKINENLYINELYHGPTRAFKDLALQPFGSLFSDFNDKSLIICATSGDTGPATLKSFENSKNIKVICIYPDLATSKVQALQMRSLDKNNLKTLAIKGNFDDAQKILKQLLKDDDFKNSIKNLGYNLSSANSINFGRILFQIIYHYFVSLKFNKKIDIIIPSGNFGNALSAYYAKKMGANINKIKIASNRNNILSEFFNTGKYDLRNKTLQNTISPAMDILISSNIERLLFDKFKDEKTKKFMQDLNENKFFTLEKDEFESLKEDFEADFCTDLECMQNIKKISKDYLIDPHTATCFKFNIKNKTIICSTAKWNKFTPSMYKSLFDNECKDEKKSFYEICEKYNEKIDENIKHLFEFDDKKYEIYNDYEIKNKILEWIKS